MTATLNVLRESEVRALLDLPTARRLVREAFVALHRGQAEQPDVLHADFPDAAGEAHVKGAWLGPGHPLWAVKYSAGFYHNRDQGLPVANGLSLVISAETGLPHTLVLDGGWLTEIRTGATGALSVELLARPATERLAIIGSGTQARHQLDAILAERTPRTVTVYAPTPERVARYVADVRAAHDIDVIVAPSLQAAIDGADVIVTTTPARDPIVPLAWVAPGCHIVAMGSDLPPKRELALALLQAAHVVAADSVRQAGLQGEIHHAFDAGVLDPADVVELGAIAAGDHPGRTDPDGITIADLTGLGVQDAAVATYVVAAAELAGAGEALVL